MIPSSPSVGKASKLLDSFKEYRPYYIGFAIGLLWGLYVLLVIGFFRQPMAAAVSFGVLMAPPGILILYGIGHLLLKREPTRRMRLFASAVLGFATGAWMPTLIFLWAFGINQILYKLPGRYLNWAAFITLPAGYLAHRFKRFDQRYYGRAEVLVGFATAFGITTKSQNTDAAEVLALLGAMYVVARGFNNIHEAKEKRNNTCVV